MVSFVAPCFQIFVLKSCRLFYIEVGRQKLCVCGSRYDSRYRVLSPSAQDSYRCKYLQQCVLYSLIKLLIGGPYRIMYALTPIVVARLPMFTMQPNNTRWLTSEERHLAQIRLAEDAGEADEDTSSDSYVYPILFKFMLLSSGIFSALSGLIMALKDPKTSIFAIMTCSQLLGLSFVNFFPTYVAFLNY